MCPACGDSFVPPQSSPRCFCPHCGKPVDIAQARALEEMLRSAQETARVAQETARRAQQASITAQQAAEESKRQAAEQAAAFAAEQAAMEEERRAAEQRATQERFAQERRAAEQRAAQERAAKAATEHRAAQEATQRAQAQRQAQAPQPVTYRHDATVRDTATGRGLFVVTLPTTWKVGETRLGRVDSASHPYRPFASFSDGAGNMITLRVDDAGTQMSDGMKAVMRTYGSAIAALDRTNYARMPHPLRLADDHILKVTQSVQATGLCLAREWGSPDLQMRQQQAQSMFRAAAQATGPALLKSPFAAEFVRIYEFEYAGVPRSAAVYVRLFAIKDASGIDLMPVGLAGSLGGAIGGAIGNAIARKRSKSPAQGTAPSGPVRTADAPAWCVPSFDDYIKGGTIYWSVQGLSALVTRRDTFDQCFEQVFLPLVRTYQIHQDVLGLSGEAGRQYAASVQQATNAQIARMNAQTQAALAADRQRQAAFDAQLASWHANSDAHHAAFRAQTNAQFNDGYGGSAPPDFSEAIRGVNTFVTSDGREVELDVSADRAYENQAGDVIGGSGGFDPGADWTEIPRA